ncbi:hypothetical protein ACIODT_11175 [Streptomyces sp. NPDC088251]|uniref:hypothetical protein n=1 Tax=Streptomyces sp. NPDC088251 TaxID=3365844 RepID=UPI00382EA10F
MRASELPPHPAVTTVRVWDLTTGQRVGPELVFPAEVHPVAVTPDGWLVVGFGQEAAVMTPC